MESTSRGHFLLRNERSRQEGGGDKSPWQLESEQLSKFLSYGFYLSEKVRLSVELDQKWHMGS